jgi:cytochrome c553
MWSPKTATRLSAILTLFLAAHSSAPAAEISTILSECAACHGADGVGRDVEIPKTKVNRN